MTESEWLACNCSVKMSISLNHFAIFAISGRKLRLFSCACCRRILHLLTDERNQGAVDIVECVADGIVAKQELNTLRRRLTDAQPSSPIGLDWGPEFARQALEYATDGPLSGGWQSAYCAVKALAYGPTGNRREEDGLHFLTIHNAELSLQACLLRDIFGNPFRPLPTIDPVWLTFNGATIPKLAQLIYDERRFEDMAILADALMDAGCHDEEILSHCRSEGPHVRGCWAVDVILDKK